MDTIFQRLIGEKDSRPLIRELTTDQLRAFIGKKFSDRKIYYEQADIFVDEEQVTLEMILEKIFHA